MFNTVILKNPVLMASIGGPSGIRGEVRVKAFTGDPLALADYGSLYSKRGDKFTIAALRLSKKIVIVKFKGINSRDMAEKLNGTQLFIDRTALPDDTEEDEFYITDLIGLNVLEKNGETIGTIKAVPNFGAGDMLEISGSGKTWFLEFTATNVPDINIEKGYVTIVKPQEIDERDQEASH